MGLSQSQFLHALGWATLNSLWQMALLWCVFLAAKSLFKLSASQKYKFSVSAIIIGFVWAVSTFLIYYQTGQSYRLKLFDQALPNRAFMPVFLTAASVTYLMLLLVPAYRLVLNWRYTHALRTTGLQKIDVQYKLFSKKIALQLGITKNVAVYISEFIKSPVTIGFLKPIILLPIASMNSLTTQQVEAVLLHELAHIRRFDYIVNLLLNITHTVLYFNPFVKFFLRVAEEEREHCCDEMVLQFGYDPIGYATALLTLEKASSQTHILAIGAAGGKNLLARIERIVGIKKRPVFTFNHLAGFMATLVCILATNALLVISKENASSLSFANPVNPFYFFREENYVDNDKKAVPFETLAEPKSSKSTRKLKNRELIHEIPAYLPPPEPEPPKYLQVAFDEIDAGLNKDQKNKVKETVEITKKVLSTFEWNEIENSIGDVLTTDEKQAAREEYLTEIEKIDWENFEKNLKSEYEKINWEKVDSKLATALSLARLDSIIAIYEDVYKTLELTTLSGHSLNGNEIRTQSLPIPDESIIKIEEKKQLLKQSLDTLKSIRRKDIIKL